MMGIAKKTLGAKKDVRYPNLTISRAPLSCGVLEVNGMEQLANYTPLGDKDVTGEYIARSIFHHEYHCSNGYYKLDNQHLQPKFVHRHMLFSTKAKFLYLNRFKEYIDEHKLGDAFLATGNNPVHHHDITTLLWNRDAEAWVKHVLTWSKATRSASLQAALQAAEANHQAYKTGLDATEETITSLRNQLKELE